LKLNALFHSERPINRSELRMFLGKLYFTWRRYFKWIFNRSIKYAAIINDIPLPYLIATHSTPLYRRLRNVEMWLQQNKVTNLKLAAVKINGLILKPGETFSLWRLVGKPTKVKGFMEGMVLTNGSFCPGVGGGLCQLSNLIYWMAIHTPLTVTERWRHTHDVFPDTNRTQPFGSGATVVYNYIDLQIRNDTSQNYQLLLWLSDLELHGEWRSEQSSARNYEVYESNHLISQEWWGGYMRHNAIRRRVFDTDNKQVGDDFITENHAIMMYEPMLPECKEMPDHSEVYQSKADKYELLISREDYQGNICRTLRDICSFADRDIIDMGAGTGRLTCLVASEANSIIAFDLSPQMLDVTSEKLKTKGLSNWRTEVADHRTLPLDNDSADIVLAGWSICYLGSTNVPNWHYNIESVFAEMKRIVRPGGILIILETLGTGTEEPDPPKFLTEYYKLLEEFGFSHKVIRTDYQFQSPKEAEDLTRFFFCNELANRVNEQGMTILPECTGVWWLIHGTNE